VIDKLINDAIIQGLEVEVWRTYDYSFGTGDYKVDELMGRGKIVSQTDSTIVLEDGDHYPKDDSEIRIKQKDQYLPASPPTSE